METAAIDNRFKYHIPNAEDIDYYMRIRSTTKVLAIIINDLCPEGREKSLAITKIEEAVMWANASIARDQ